MEPLTGLELRLLRLQRHLTQAQAARAYGVSQGHYAQCEAVDSPKVIGFERLVDARKQLAFGTPLGDEGEPVWIVCRLDLSTARFVPVPESRKRRLLERLPVFRDPGKAAEVADFVARHYPLNSIRPMPAWREFVVQSLLQHRLPADDFYVADDKGSDPTTPVGRALISGLRIVRAKLAEVNP